MAARMNTRVQQTLRIRVAETTMRMTKVERRETSLEGHRISTR